MGGVVTPPRGYAVLTIKPMRWTIFNSIEVIDKSWLLWFVTKIERRIALI